MRFIPRHAGLALALLMAAALPGHAAEDAKDFPRQGVRIVNPFPPGSPVETLGRLVSQSLEKEWGKFVIIESKSGAGGTIGASFVAKSAPDGYNLLVSTASPITFAAAMYKKLPYDPVKDLVPVWGIATPGQVVIVNDAVPARNLAELVAYARANPGKLAYGSAGTGTVQHFAGELFQAKTGTKLVHVPYKGGAPAATDLAAGHIQVMFDSLTNQLRNIDSGKARPLAIMRARRDAKLPQVPTAAEAGVQGVELVNWIAVLAPAGMDPAILRKLRDTVRRVMATPENQERLRNVFGDIQALDGEQIEKMIPVEAKAYTELVESAGIERQ